MRATVLVFLATTSIALSAQVKTGAAAFEEATQEKPGNRVHITVADLPAPNTAESVANFVRLVPRGSNVPMAPAGYKVDLYVGEGKFENPRQIRTAPNGDMFLADTTGNSVWVLRGAKADGTAATVEQYATGLSRPFGINFYPAANPQWVYVANINSVVRFPYKADDLKASGAPETIVKEIATTSGHSTRDLVFTKDGRMLISVGSSSNIDDPDDHPGEFHRANVLEYKPDGTFVKVYAAGIRNCVGEAVNPATGELWCSVNERDGLGHHLVPDYVSSIKEGGFYGWPWWYMGGKQDPRHVGKHPELQAKTITPDILMQPHMASLGIAFYTGKMFPGVTGDIFAAEHGSWNRAPRAGYEVAHAKVVNGKATGEYEDFLTNFALPNGDVWGRPVGVAVAPDGALIVVEDGAKTVWRVTYVGAQRAAK